MKNIFLNAKYLVIALGFATCFSACVDLEFEAPIAYGICSAESTANMTIAELKDMHVFGNEELISDSIIISGVVVGDDATGNFYKKLVIQDETAGIEVYFGSTDLYNLFPNGTQVYINCTGLTLSDYNGVTQLGTIEQAIMGDFICKGSSDMVIEPRDVEIGDLGESDISTLIRLSNVQFTNASAGATFADADGLNSINHTIESCDNNDVILLRTSGYSDFAGFFTPTGSGTITAVYSVFGDDQQLYINSPADIEFTSDRCGEVVVAGDVNEDFESTTENNLDVDIAGWTNIAVKGTRLWRGKDFDDNLYVQATSYNDSADEMEAWLITSAIDLSSDMKLNFDSQVGFPVGGHDGLKVYISTDFDGFNFATASWTELSGDIANSTSTQNVWINSGDIDLSAYSGTGYIGFQYTGSGPAGQTSSYRIDNVVVEAN